MIPELAPPLSFKSDIVVLKQKASGDSYESKIIIENTSEEHVAVIVKCNAQNLYAIKARHFIIEPPKTKNIKIVTKEEFVDVNPEKIKDHKLLIEYTRCEPNAPVNEKAFWEEAKSTLQRKVLKFRLNEESEEENQLETSSKLDDPESGLFKSMIEMSPKKEEEEPVMKHRPAKRPDDDEIEDEENTKLKGSEVEDDDEGEKPSEVKETEQLIKDKDSQAEINDIEEQVVITKMDNYTSEGHEKEKAKGFPLWIMPLISLMIVGLLLLAFNHDFLF